ncbi:MAG: hypothetical protein NT098_03690 [Candidatus Parcubacteria bacterium]|nr:hypothetical protein [Candidatus Parcubacteria bacterium]
MVIVIKKTRYTVDCKGCNNTLQFDADDVEHKKDEVYGDVPASEGGEKASYFVNRYFISCPVCGSHVNVAKIASAEMKRKAKKR